MKQNHAAMLALAQALRAKAKAEPTYRLDMYFYVLDEDKAGSNPPCMLGFGVLYVPEFKPLDLGFYWIPDIFAKKLEMTSNDFEALFDPMFYDDSCAMGLDPLEGAQRIESWLESQGVGLQVTRKSPYDGKVNTLFIPGLTPAMVDELSAPRTERRLMQNIMPDIPQELREFVTNGYTPEDWEAMFPKEDEDDEA